MSVDYAPTAISKEFGAALATAQSEMEAVQRNSSNPAFKRGKQDSRYADISAILDAVKPPLNKAGIALTMPALNREDGCVGAYLELRFESEVIVVPPFWIKPASGIPHAMVAALTYARRAAVTSYFSIPQEDDDGNTASDHENANRAEYAAPAGKGAARPRQAVADDEAVRAAAEKEANERAEAERKAALKARQKEAMAAFGAKADEYGFVLKEDEDARRLDLILLANILLDKEKFTTDELFAAVSDFGKAQWDAAIDAANEAIAKLAKEAEDNARRTREAISQ